MTCREFVDFLDDYRSGQLPHGQRAEFDRHMELCESCVCYLDGYQKTIELSRRALCDPEGAVPSDVPEELIRAILAARRKDA